MNLLIVCVAAILASALTLFSGFWLGTLLMPVVALFFPLELAIAMTAIVHLTTNLFKIGLLGRKADHPVLLKFGLPAIAAAFSGVVLLTYLGELNPIYEYHAFGSIRQVSALKLVVGVLIISFVTLELYPILLGGGAGSQMASAGRRHQWVLRWVVGTSRGPFAACS